MPNLKTLHIEILLMCVRKANLMGIKACKRYRNNKHLLPRFEITTMYHKTQYDVNMFLNYYSRYSEDSQYSEFFMK